MPVYSGALWIACHPSAIAYKAAISNKRGEVWTVRFRDSSFQQPANFQRFRLSMVVVTSDLSGT